jgi:predicted 3-demethylubiquinone-9 3-methyltransferase (glyoxalase superfamily)
MHKLTTFLWFDGQAEEAMNYYTSVFRNSKKGMITRWGDTGPGPKDSVLVVTFEIEGQQFAALNGGPQYKFTPAISIAINCTTQAEIDELWAKLGADGGQPVQCGWITDKFGVSWQVVPTVLSEMLQDKDRARANRVMSAMMQMVKLDIAALERAYRGE